MTRVLYDSVNVSALPLDGDMYAGYVDGLYANVAELRRKFPHKPIVTITVLGVAGANVCDCESGDLTPAQAATWAQREIHAGRKPTIYTSASEWNAVKTAVHALGIQRDVSYFIAHYDGDPVLPPGAVAKQYLGDHPNGHGGTYDKSSVTTYWPGVDPAPTPPAPHPPLGDEMRLYRVDGTDPVWLWTPLGKHWVQDRAELLQVEKDTGLQVILLPHGSKFLDRYPTVGAVPK